MLIDLEYSQMKVSDNFILSPPKSPCPPMSNHLKLALMAHLDARLTGDQEVAGLTPAEICNILPWNILPWRLIMKYFLRSFSHFR